MRTENQCKPSERFLFADAYFSDKAIEIWKSECIMRCKDKKKGNPYEKYINWIRKENEIAVFTLYAYADFAIPKKFDIIFCIDEPKIFLEIEYELTQSIHEGWLPLESVEHGHKHLCIFKFENKLPDILNILHKEDDKFLSSPKGQKVIGFCNSKDFSAISERIEKTIELKILYGDNWWKYDDGE